MTDTRPDDRPARVDQLDPIVPIELIVAGAYPDPDTGAPLAVGVQRVVIDASLDGREAELLDDLGLGRRVAVVSDADTRAALGARVERALSGSFAVQPVTLPRAPHADDATLAHLDAAIAPGTDAIVAVGAGTINDLCKKLAADRGRPYAVFGTAPSMNGYASSTASITVAGVKSSLPARAPVGVFLDLGVLARAPLRLIRGGLGECLCRSTAQADWLLSHLVRDTPYREVPFSLLVADEDRLVDAPEAAVAGDLDALGCMARILVLSGFGMTIVGGSQPASQGEHMISHVMDMIGGGPARHHGEQIAVCTVVMAQLQERLLAGDPPRVRESDTRERDVIAYFGADRGAALWRASAGKRLDAAAADAMTARLAERWDAIGARLGAATRPAAQITAALARAGAPTAPADLGWSDPAFAAACAHARHIRDRYTALDLAASADAPIWP